MVATVPSRTLIYTEVKERLNIYKESDTCYPIPMLLGHAGCHYCYCSQVKNFVAKFIWT